MYESEKDSTSRGLINRQTNLIKALVAASTIRTPIQVTRKQFYRCSKAPLQINRKKFGIQIRVSDTDGKPKNDREKFGFKITVCTKIKSNIINVHFENVFSYIKIGKEKEKEKGYVIIKGYNII